MNAAELLDRYLVQFNNDNPIYKALIAEKDGVATPYFNPENYGIGGIANILEWLRLLGIEAKDQIFFDIAQPKYLNFTAAIIGLVRWANEIDPDFIKRIREYLIGPKISPGSLIHFLRPYSTTEPVIYEGESDACYADASFADYYKKFQVPLSPASKYAGYWILPAISLTQNGGLWYFKVILSNTQSLFPVDGFRRVLDIINRWKAAGIRYTLEIQTI